MSLVEVAILSVILLVAVGGLSGAVVSSTHVARSNDEVTLASTAARRMADELATVPFGEVFARYNATDADDPVGGAPGDGFAVEGLTPLIDDADGLVGRILFPTIEVGSSHQLREDLEEPRLGMPRDLNGDGDVDAVDHAGDYAILPVSVQVTWSGVSGTNVHQLDLILMNP